MKKTVSIASLLMILASTAHADTNSLNLDIEQVRTNLKAKYPSTTVTSITKATMGDLYEVVMGKNIAYVDKETKYIMFGHIFDMTTQQDMSQARLDEINKVDFAKLPFDKAIKVKKGKGTRKFAVFTDPDCPYCKQFEANLASVDNYTMYVFLFPIEQLHPTARVKAEAIWCSKDKVAAWHDVMLNDKEIVSKKCATPLDSVAQLGQELNVQGTPTLFNSSGMRAPGAMPAQTLEMWLDIQPSNSVK